MIPMALPHPPVSGGLPAGNTATVERGSDKHAPEVDDQMKRESEALERGAPQDPRADEGRRTEGPVELESEEDVEDEGSTPAGPEP